MANKFEGIFFLFQNSTYFSLPLPIWYNIFLFTRSTLVGAFVFVDLTLANPERLQPLLPHGPARLKWTELIKICETYHSSQFPFFFSFRLTTPTMCKYPLRFSFIIFLATVTFVFHLHSFFFQLISQRMSLSSETPLLSPEAQVPFISIRSTGTSQPPWIPTVSDP